MSEEFKKAFVTTPGAVGTLESDITSEALYPLGLPVKAKSSAGGRTLVIEPKGSQVIFKDEDLRYILDPYQLTTHQQRKVLEDHLWNEQWGFHTRDPEFTDWILPKLIDEFGSDSFCDWEVDGLSSKMIKVVVEMARDLMNDNFNVNLQRLMNAVVDITLMILAESEFADDDQMEQAARDTTYYIFEMLTTHRYVPSGVNWYDPNEAEKKIRDQERIEKFEDDRLFEDDELFEEEGEA
jgi:hypothetical protein